MTLYDTLGVREDASVDEIKRAYRKAAMRAHPDRNQGREAAAHDAFQEVKQAYAILSDPEQRRVYDAVFAQEMSKLREQEEREARHARERAEREANAERERYAQYVAQAMRFAERGHNRDVVFGVLLGAQCDESTARQIADSAIALHESRQEREESKEKEREEEPVAAKKEEKEPAAADASNPLGAMWFQFLNNLRF